VTSSSIPAALDALYSSFVASNSLAGVQITDGAPMTDLASDFITVGWTPYDDAAAASQQVPAQLGQLRRQEEFVINCYADSYSGDASTSTRRARVFALVDACDAVLVADPTLGGALTQYALLTSVDLRQERSERGLSIGAVFRITCRTRIV
jgi:hypothetical protein